MFKANKVNESELLSSWECILGPKAFAALKLSKDYQFYKWIFSRICEEDFSVLYSEDSPTRNCPVNCLMAALILIQMKNLSHEEFFNRLKFDVGIRFALGLKGFDERPFVERTFYNFKNRLSEYAAKMGINLVAQVFSRLSAEYIRHFKVKTDIQRLDGVLINSNIRAHSRLSLLVEVLCRLHRVLSAEDQAKHAVWFKPYLKGGEKYVYGVRPDAYDTQLEYLGAVYHALHEDIAERYADEQDFKIFQRAYKEHFKVVEDEGAEQPIEVRPSGELSSDCMQSPDDLEATYRPKNGKKHQGYVAVGTETCHPDNELNLITHLATAPNNTDDSVILENSLDEMKAHTPDLKELHGDGGFPSEGVDIKAQQHGINIIQTAVKGKTASVIMEVKGDEQSGFIVNCPGDKQPPKKAEKAGKNFKVVYNFKACIGCPFFDECPTKAHRNEKKQTATFRFKATEPLKQKRHKALQKIPAERRTLRPAVERLMASLRRGEKRTGKLKVRGRCNFDSYIFCMGIAINFERIYRHNNPFSQFLSVGQYMERLVSMNLSITYIKYLFCKCI